MRPRGRRPCRDARRLPMGKKLLLWIDNAALYRDALARAGIADQLDIEDVAMAAQASDASSPVCAWRSLTTSLMPDVSIASAR